MRMTETTMASTPGHPTDSWRGYAVIWGALLLLTGLTVAAAGFDIGGAAIVVCLGIATGKSLLVLFYFMHLRHEKRLIIKLIIPIALAALAIFIGLTYVDVLTRGEGM
jgi:cytochrome c oxidase subunit 4